MATSTATPEPLTATVAPAKVGLSSILIAVLASTLCALLVVAGAGYWLLRSGKLAAAVSSSTKAHSVVDSSAELLPSHVLALEPMVVNLPDTGGRSYLRVSISLRVVDEPLTKGKKKPESKADKPDLASSAAFRDTTLRVLGSETADALLASGGLDALKKKLRQTYALENRELHVLDVYVTDFLVQRG